MPNWLEGEVHVHGVRLHYYRTGGEKPPLVLAHGWTNSGLCWTQTAQALEADYDVVMCDARGHGQSEPLVGPFGEAERSADLIGLVETLGLKQPGLMGHSMGAATVAAVAAQRPDLPKYILLEDPPWYDSVEASAARRSRNETWMKWLRGVRHKAREAALEEYRRQNPQWSEQTLNLRLDAFVQMDLRVLTDIQWDMTPWRELVQKFQCPGLLITGESEREGIVSPSMAQEAATLWQPAGGRWAQIPGAGHNVRYDQFEAYIEAVKLFLNVMRDA
jgi:pimeloyl-ACP methyl ester carboxylesterase